MRDLKRQQLWVIGPEPEDGIERPSRLPLGLGERFPRSCQQLVAPTADELHVRIARLWSGGWVLSTVSQQRLGPLPLLLVIDNEMDERRSNEVTEAAPLGIGPSKVAADDAQRELLRQLLRRVRIVQRTKQVTVNRAAVALDQQPLGGGDLIRLALMRLADDRPERRDPAEAQIEVVLIHGVTPTSGVALVPVVWICAGATPRSV